ncbi:MAG: FxsA family protein [Hyphomicrobium sp.]|nr:FxsA family protein [Hyphomicrobium sp.]
MMSPLHLIPLLLFLAFPLLEIAVLIEVGQWIGFWPTLGLLVLAAAVGMLVIRQQGLSMLRHMFDSMSRGGLAITAMVDSYAVIVAGCLLIVPGFLTDALGLALLVPPLRRWLVGAVLPGLAAPRPDRARPEQPARPRKQPIVIEGTYQRLDDDTKR